MGSGTLSRCGFRAVMPALYAVSLWGCGTAIAPGDDAQIREQKGYVCSSEYACPESLRCYKRYPMSIGRCVTAEYYESHDRGCYVDSDCKLAEECVGRTKDWAGKCVQSFRRTPAIDSEAE